VLQRVGGDLRGGADVEVGQGGAVVGQGF
jgi:hypothetical protein